MRVVFTFPRLAGSFLMILLGGERGLNGIRCHGEVAAGQRAGFPSALLIFRSRRVLFPFDDTNHGHLETVSCFCLSFFFFPTWAFLAARSLRSARDEGQRRSNKHQVVTQQLCQPSLRTTTHPASRMMTLRLSPSRQRSSACRALPCFSLLSRWYTRNGVAQYLLFFSFSAVGTGKKGKTRI